MLKDNDYAMTDDLNVLSEALQDLKGVNGLCQGRLEIDFSEVELPDLEEAPDTMMDFFGKYIVA